MLEYIIYKQDFQTKNKKQNLNPIYQNKIKQD